MDISLISTILESFLLLLFLGALFAAPWVPTRRQDFDRIAQLAHLKPGQKVVELGSGTASMLRYFSRQYGIIGIGVEISPLLYLYSIIASLFYRNVAIHFGNFFYYSLSDADVVYIFLMPKCYEKLKKKLIKELKPQAKIIVGQWPLKEVKPTESSFSKGSVYYLYTKKDLASMQGL